MGNKNGTIKNRGIDLTKVLPIIKQHLSKLENQIFPNQNMHYILLDSDFDSVLANSTWSELSLSQREVHSIFSKLKLTAMQFAQTLDEAETKCIHLRGEKNLFSYYAIREYRLVIHRAIKKNNDVQSLDDSSLESSSSRTRKLSISQNSPRPECDEYKSEEMDQLTLALIDILYNTNSISGEGSFKTRLSKSKKSTLRSTSNVDKDV